MSPIDPIWQSVLINLSTGMLGVALLFFLVDRFFLSDEWSLSDRIEQLVRRLELSSRPAAHEFFVSQPDFVPYIKTAKRIRFCGLTLTKTINSNFGYLRERLAQGASIDLLLAAPDSLALRMSALRSEKPDDIEYYTKRLESAFKDIGYLFEIAQSADSGGTAPRASRLAVHLLDYAPSFSMCQFEGQDGNDIMFVELYTHGTGYVSPPIFEVTPERDPVWYEYFVAQFDYMWQRSSVWSPELATALGDQSGPSRRRVSAGELLVTKPRIPEGLMAHANVLCFSGYTLSRTVRDYLRQIDQCLVAGGEVKVIIIDDEVHLLEECVRRSQGRTSASHWRKRLESTESLVEVTAGTPDLVGKIELGRLPYLPSFGFLMVDPDTEHGVIVVELYHHRSAEENPTFELRPERDGEWYDFFRRQYEILWESCRVQEFGEQDGN